LNKKPALTSKFGKSASKSLPAKANAKAVANAFGKKGAAMKNAKATKPTPKRGKGDVSAYV
jgi:hypothetical protein